MHDMFDSKLIEVDNPFPYPHPPDRPPFIIGGESLLKWFDQSYNNTTRRKGTIGFFIVGRPGAGKTYFLKHLDFLFYDQRAWKDEEKYNGIYAYATLSNLDFSEDSLWKELFGGKDSKGRLASLITKKKVNSSQIRVDIRDNLLRLLDGSLNFNTYEFRDMAKAITKLLPDKSAICIALDNVEEYLDARKKHALSLGWAKTEEDSYAYAVDELTGSIRNMTDCLRKGMVILAITDEIWKNVKDAVGRARTKGRRFQFTDNEELVLPTLSLPQCFQLVFKYMQNWGQENDLTLPDDQKECLCTIGSETVSIYPFTPMSIDFAYKMTDKLPGDISCFCASCIDIMRNKRKQVEIVKDKLIIESMHEVSEKYKSLGWGPKANQLIREMGSVIREQSLISKLAELKKKLSDIKAEYGEDRESITSSINRFADLRGIEISTPPNVPDAINESKTVVSHPDLKIWSFAETKFAVRYVLGDPTKFIPTVRMYGDSVNSQPYREIMSLIKSDEATHGLLILLYQSEARRRLGHVIEGELAAYGDTIRTLDLTEKLDEIRAVAEAGETQELLAQLVDHLGNDPIYLRETLEALSRQKRPESKPIEKYNGPKYTTGQY